MTCITAATWRIASGEHQPCTFWAEASAGRAAECLVGVALHRASIEARSAGGHLHLGGVGNDRGIAFEIDGLVPADRERVRRSVTGRSLPRIGSSIAMHAMKSAITDPSPMCLSDCRFTNEGSRMCTRAGLAEPSATTKQPSSPRGDSTAE